MKRAVGIRPIFPEEVGDHYLAVSEGSEAIYKHQRRSPKPSERRDFHIARGPDGYRVRQLGQGHGAVYIPGYDFEDLDSALQFVAGGASGRKAKSWGFPKGAFYQGGGVGRRDWPPTIGKWRIKGWDGYGSDEDLSAFYQGDGDESAFWIYETSTPGRFKATEEGWQGRLSSHQGSKADMLKILSGADKPVREMTAQELCGIGDKACRAELKRRGRDPKTGKKRR